MRNYYLVHGAWHGSWCYNKLTPILEKSGSNIYLCDLPGHYTNKADFSKITLNTYVNHVCDFIQKNIPGEVILVGHSMGGMVISQVAENLPGKISNLVYISAFVPGKDSSLADEEKMGKQPTVSLKMSIDMDNFAIKLKNEDCISLFYNQCNQKDVKFALSNIQDQPLLAFNSKVSLGNNFDGVHKTYIECLNDAAILIEDQRRMNASCQKIITLDSDHSPFFCATKELAEILINV